MLPDLWIMVAAPLVRAVGGWLENSLDPKSDGGAGITWPEWTRLVKTVFKLGVPGLFLYYGLELPVEFAASLPILVDYALNWFGKRIKK